ncbi:MAG: ABC transporter substrate-binding protein [Deltaproteobacteria bacterium]|nr:ABC transporter substrate-binding protein [Deltaproteobacteria bacterium]
MARGNQTARALTWQSPGLIAGIVLFFVLSSFRPADARIFAAYSSISGSFLGLFVAKDAGYFAEQGLDVQLLYIASGTTLTQALIGGDVQIGFGNGISALRAKLQGADLVIVGVSVDRMIFSLFSRREIRTPADLKGRKVGVTRFGGAPDIWVRIVLSRLNMVPEKDVALIQMGGQPGILGGLTGGSIDAGVLSPPTLFTAAELGLHELISFKKWQIPAPHVAILSSSGYLARKGEEVERFLRAYVIGVHRVKTDPTFAKQSLARYTKVQDPKVLTQTYELWKDMFTRLPAITDEAVAGAIAEVVKIDPKVRDLPRESYLNPAFVRRVEASGLLEKLYGKP